MSAVEQDPQEGVCRSCTGCMPALMLHDHEQTKPWAILCCVVAAVLWRKLLISVEFPGLTDGVKEHQDEVHVVSHPLQANNQHQAAARQISEDVSGLCCAHQEWV